MPVCEKYCRMKNLITPSFDVENRVNSSVKDGKVKASYDTMSKVSQPGSKNRRRPKWTVEVYHTQSGNASII